MASVATSRCYCFGRFELQVDERRLLREGTEVSLGPHAFDVLIALVDRAGHLVTKDELLERVWGKVVVEENTLQVHISALRKALGTEAITTISGRGYRFVLPVSHGNAPASSSSAPPKTNLPVPVTSFIGREGEIPKIADLLARTRLLTLTGAGGCGKTRLALRVAGGVATRYPDGIWLVELAPLGDPTLLARTVANVLGIKEQGAMEPAQSLAEWLASRHALIVLDNAEHLLESCARFVDFVMRRCAGLTLLVTSRERLGIEGEATYRVPSLSVPRSGGAADIEEILASEAARLFIDRARLQRPALELTSRDALALRQICCTLDGIALAIELAAPRLRAMSLVELSQRITDRFAVLSEGSRTAAPRHRTLRALVDWSYGLLGDAEKTLLQRVSVFSGGWTLEAAEQVCSGGPIGRGDILNLLTSLVDKSLLIADTQGEFTRYGLLETVRHFSRDRLRENGDEEAVRARHFDYLLTLAVKLDEAPDDAIASSCLRQVEDEFDNLRSAMSWCEEDACRAVNGILLAGRLYWFWDKRGYYGEGRDWLARLLAAGKHHKHGEPHARALHAAGTLALLQGDTLAAEQHHTAALGVWRQLGDRRQELRSLGSLGNIHYQRNELDQAHDLYEQAVGVARQLDDRRAIVVGLINLAYLTYHRRDLMTSARCAQESLELGRQGRAWAIPQAATHLALIRFGQGDITAAKTFISEADTCRAELGLRWPFCMVVQGMIARHEGDFPAARKYLKEALLEAQASGEMTIIVESLEASAGLAVDLQNPSVAVGLWGLADQVRKQNCISIPGPDSDRRDREMALARASIGGEIPFNNAWAEGSGWTIDEAVRCAVEI